jgi:serine/threonine-protein kinase
MGEVYRAKDTKLGRDVALKILPASFTNDPERVARFRREAQVLASLNHPHIAQIHGLEEASGTQFLVLELVDGDTLDKRIARGPIPVDEALGIAKQIAEALEAAHEKSIIHRDLKPANIALTKDGSVKVLDFGLAKAVEGTAPGSDLSMSPTITTPAMMTGVGVILGTAAYMSPEQAKGFPADHRSDIFSFGVVLHEMLTGRRPFQGETVAEIVASVLVRDADLAGLPADVNPRLAELLRRCFEKHPKKRWQAIGDLGVELQAISAAPHVVGSASVQQRFWRRAFLIISGVFVGIVVTGIAVWSLKPSPVAPHLVRFTITPSGALPLPTGSRGTQSPYRDIVLSPDGKRVIYNVATAGAGVDDPQLWVRALDQLDGVKLPGIVGNLSGFPFMSPDGQWIAYVWGGELRKVSIFGGPPIPLCRVPGNQSGFRGGSWGPDNRIIFASDDTATGLLSVPAGGGEASVLTKPDRGHGEQDHLFPWILPDGRAALFTIVTGGSIETAAIAALDLKTGQQKVLVRGGTAAQYVDSGYLVYASAGSLRAVRFNPARLEVLSDPVPVVESVLTKPDGAAEFSVSRDGTLVYIPGGVQPFTQRELVWVDRQGREEPLSAPPRTYALPRLSPDGTRVALDVRDQEFDIWVWDLVRGTLRRLTSDPGLDVSPVWTPDSHGILFSSVRGGGMPNMYRQAADGTGATEALPQLSDGLVLTSIAPDGTRAVGMPPTGTGPTSIMVMTFGEKPHVDPLLQTKFVTRNPEIAPDGRWVAYESNESGRAQVYVRPFPNVETGSWQVSTQGGTKPVWAPSGRELFYIDADGYLTGVPVQIVTTFIAGNPARMLQTRYFSAGTGRSYDVSRDGQKFLMIKDATANSSNPPPSMVIVLNWVDELKTKLPMKQ